MRSAIQSSLRRFAGFCSDRHRGGGVAVEFALVAPLLILLLAGTVQAGALIYLRQQMYQTAHDAARRVAVAELTTAEARTFVGTQLAAWHGSFAINVTTASGASNDVNVSVSIPLTDVTFLDPLGLFTSGTISVAATMRREL